VWTGDVTTSLVKVNQISMAELLSFGYCSMQHHLRFRLGLPWFPGSAEAGVARVARRAVLEFMSLQKQGRDGSTFQRRMSGRSTIAIVNLGFEKLYEAFPTRAVTIEGARSPIMMAISSTKKIFVHPVDEMVGTNIPYIETVRQGDTVVSVKGFVDAVFYRKAGQLSEQIVVLTVISNQDPLEDLVNYRGIREGFAHLCVRKGLKQASNIPVFQKTLPVFVARDAKAPRDEYEGIRPRHSTKAHQFRTVVLEAAKGIGAGFAIPTGHPQRCTACPYGSVCTAKLAKRKKDEGNELRETLMKTAPYRAFADWPGGTP